LGPNLVFLTPVVYISERTTVRHYARSVGTLPYKGNNNGTVLQGAFKMKSPQKLTKPIRSSTISTNGTTEKQHMRDFGFRPPHIPCFFYTHTHKHKYDI